MRVSMEVVLELRWMRTAGREDEEGVGGPDGAGGSHPVRLSYQ
jgi:hypothetical protein